MPVWIPPYRGIGRIECTKNRVSQARHRIGLQQGVCPDTDASGLAGCGRDRRLWGWSPMPAQAACRAATGSFGAYDIFIGANCLRLSLSPGWALSCVQRSILQSAVFPQADRRCLFPFAQHRDRPPLTPRVDRYTLKVNSQRIYPSDWSGLMTIREGPVRPLATHLGQSAAQSASAAIL